jgi:hypothetical protein
MLYKVLNEDGSARMGTGRWFLPAGKRPGKWMPKVERLIPCQRGYHVATLEQLPNWLGPAIFEVEVRGEQVEGVDKRVVAQARLIRRLPWSTESAVSFAADCAEHVLHIFESRFPNDFRPRKAIEAARSRNRLTAYAAAYVAAYVASNAAYANDAAYAANAANAAAYAAYAANAAAYAANTTYAAHAATYAANDAANAANDADAAYARAVGYHRECQWQAQRLAFYLHGDNQ